MEYRIQYSPTEKQRLFHASPADEVLFGGAAGGGKSKAIVMDALMRCLHFAKTHAYIFRRTYGELEDTVIREALSGTKSSFPTVRPSTSAPAPTARMSTATRAWKSSGSTLTN